MSLVFELDVLHKKVSCGPDCPATRRQIVRYNDGEIL